MVANGLAAAGRDGDAVTGPPARRAGRRGGRRAGAGRRSAGGVADRPAASPRRTRPPIRAAPTADLTAAHTQHLRTVARLHVAESYDDIVAALVDTRPVPRHRRPAAARGGRGAAPGGRARPHPGGGQPVGPHPAAGPGAADRRGPSRRAGLAARPRDGRTDVPDLAAIASRAQSVAALPLTVGGRVIGVLGPDLGRAGSAAGSAPGLPRRDGRGLRPSWRCGSADSAGLPGTEDSWLAPAAGRGARLGRACSARCATAIGWSTSRSSSSMTGRRPRPAASAPDPGRSPLLTELPGPSGRCCCRSTGRCSPTAGPASSTSCSTGSRADGGPSAHPAAARRADGRSRGGELADPFVGPNRCTTTWSAARAGGRGGGAALAAAVGPVAGLAGAGRAAGLAARCARR